MPLPSTADLASTHYTLPLYERHASQYIDPCVAYNPPCIRSTMIQGQAWSAAHRSDPCQTFHNSIAFNTTGPLRLPAQSHPIQTVRNNYLHHPFTNGPIAIFLGMPDHILSTSQHIFRPNTLAAPHFPTESHSIQRVSNNNYLHHTLASGPITIFPSVPDLNLSTSQHIDHPTVHNPFFPANNSLYEAETDSRRSDTVASVPASGCPPDIGLGFDTDPGFIETHISAPVYTPQLTHDSCAFQDATLTDTTTSRQDSSAHVQPVANDSIAISPGNTGFDAMTSKWESTVLPVAQDPSLSPTDHCNHILLPHKVTSTDDFFRPAMSSGASKEHAADDPQFVSTQHHENVGKMYHQLRHVNSKQWVCICGRHFSNYYNGSRHIREFASCSACHKKVGRNGDGTYCRRCKSALECAK